MKTLIYRITIIFMFLNAVTITTGFGQSNGKLKTLNAERFEKKLDRIKNPQLIDVRRQEEYSEDHIGGSVNYNVLDSTLIKHIPELNKKKPVFVYCKTGVRGLRAAKILKANGFRVYNLEGGLNEWKDKNLPVVKE